MTRLLSIARAARELGISRQRLYYLIGIPRNHKGELLDRAPLIPSIEIDGVKFIDMDTQDKWKWNKSEEKTNT